MMDDYLDTNQAADLLGVAPSTLRYWRMHKKGPPRYQFGRVVRYFRPELERWQRDHYHHAMGENHD